MSTIKKLVLTGTLAFTLGLLLGFNRGGAYVQQKWDKHTAKVLAEDHRILLLGMKDSYDKGVEHEEQKQQIRYITQTVIKEIPVLMPDSSTCPVLPDGFGRLHRASAEAVNDAVASSKSDGKG